MNTADMKKKVLDFIREQHMVEEGDGVLAAVSGGADSVCLLFLLCSMREELAVRLAAFHLHHGLRGAEADRDEAFVKQLCGAWQIPFYSAHEDAAAYGRERGISEEEAGRELRYSHLEALADRLSFGKIAVAHHREDQAETVVFHLFRGTGLKGMGGIRPVRGKIIRPLLECSRQEIEGYLRENGISWCEDSTNSENTYKRNRIRNELLPWAGQYLNERASEHAAQFARFAAQADAYFEAQAEMILEAERRTDPEELLCDARMFRREDGAAVSYFFHHGTRRRGLSGSFFFPVVSDGVDFLASVVPVEGAVVSDGCLPPLSKGRRPVVSGRVVSSVVSGGFSCSAQYRLYALLVLEFPI